jgi:DNA-binding MarR family transcriptional regulator
MDDYIDPTMQKLLRSFEQFSKTAWHERTVAGCKPSEIRVLFCIKNGVKPDTHSMNVSEISKLLHVTSPTITQLLKGLEANDLIERSIDPADRRSIDVRLTEKGDMVTRIAWKGFTTHLHGLIEYLGEEQSNQLAELLSKVSRYFSERTASMNHSQWNGNEEV